MHNHLKYMGLCLWVLLSSAAWAGRACENPPLTSAQVYQAYQMGNRLYDALEQSQAELAMVGRVGADLSKQGLKYSHAGIVVRQHPKGRWSFVHVLNQCGTAFSKVYDEGLLNFLLDSPHRPDLLLIIPSPKLQQKLRSLLFSPLALTLHESQYSLLAYPFATRYQNSNGWLLEMIAAAQMPVPPRQRAAVQRFLLAQGYQGDEIGISVLERVGADLFKANVRFDDHPEAAEFNRRYEVVTVNSVLNYLVHTDQVQVRELGLGRP